MESFNTRSMTSMSSSKKTRENDAQRKRSKRDIPLNEISSHNSSHVQANRVQPARHQQAHTTMPVAQGTTVSTSSSPVSCVPKTAPLVIDESRLPGVHYFHPNNFEVDKGNLDEMKRLEITYNPSPHLLRRHVQLDPLKRSILVNWMMEVARGLYLKRETLHYAVNYMDRFLELCEPVAAPNFQLIGSTSLWFASKMEELEAPTIAQFSVPTISCDDIRTMENVLGATLKWRLLPPTLYSFVHLFLHRACARRATIQQSRGGERYSSFNANERWTSTTCVPHSLVHRAMEIADACLLDVDVYYFYPSEIAASILYVLLDQHKDYEGIGYEEEDVYDTSELSALRHLPHCIVWCTRFAKLQSEKSTLNVRASYIYSVERQDAILSHLPHQDTSTIQMYNTQALLLYRHLSGNNRHRHHQQQSNGNPMISSLCLEHVALRTRLAQENEMAESEIQQFTEMSQHHLHHQNTPMSPRTIGSPSARTLPDSLGRVGSPMTQLANKMQSTTAFNFSSTSISSQTSSSGGETCFTSSSSLGRQCADTPKGLIRRPSSETSSYDGNNNNVNQPGGMSSATMYVPQERASKRKAMRTCSEDD